ncbi:MAG: hypothetical protein IKH24_06380 [Bacteroidales bacterium]|nr:hypothetical protein [Bacteroidales bacterium]
MKKTIQAAVLLLLAAFFTESCATSARVQQLKEQQVTAQLSLPEMERSPFENLDIVQATADSLVFQDFNGNDVLIMNAVRDEATGEMVASETLQGARVTARFRNVAERGGQIRLEFQIIVPAALQDGRWQVRFHPRMRLTDGEVPLDDILITGLEYRKGQLRGYRQYERYLRSIITDSTRFIDRSQLELYFRRNNPEQYGVTQRQALVHYTYGMRVRRNERRIRDREKMFHHYVKAPVQTDHLRLDTLLVNEAGEFVYHYVQSLSTQPQLNKIEIRLSGEVREQDRLVYAVPESEPLTFYVSSLSTLVDGRERYVDRLVSRRVTQRTSAQLLFGLGDDTVREDLGDNLSEILRIRESLSSLLAEDDLVLDSVIVTAAASPEGSFRSNGTLSRRRGWSVSRYFASEAAGIRFCSYAVPENWELLDSLVAGDVRLTERQKDQYARRRKTFDPDRRERLMRGDDYYAYVSEELYPKLRNVVFDFRLHRRNMLQDTIHTSVLDTAYMAGVQALRDHDYRKALSLLRPYADFNTAIAYSCLDYNASALAILEKQERSAPVDYMLALLYSRQGDDRNAVACYLRSCEEDGSYVHRGNLDPEISALIRKYDLNR